MGKGCDAINKPPSRNTSSSSADMCITIAFAGICAHAFSPLGVTVDSISQLSRTTHIEPLHMFATVDDSCGESQRVQHDVARFVTSAKPDEQRGSINRPVKQITSHHRGTQYERDWSAHYERFQRVRRERSIHTIQSFLAANEPYLAGMTMALVRHRR